MKDKYRQLCNKENMPIFLKDWWLDIVSEASGGEWDVIVSEKGNNIQAALPYFFYIKKGINIKAPILTQFTGMWINYPKNQKMASRISYERKLLRDIINQLEEKDINSYSQNFTYKFTNWLPFYWRGFKQTTRYTYVIPGNLTEEEVYAGIDSATKNLIRKAEKFVTVKEDLDIEKFYEINSLTFKRKNMEAPYSISTIKKIDEACKERECRKILYAEDENGNIHASIYLVWDETSMYYLMGGIDPEFKYSNATSLLISEAIKIALNNKLDFDFEGSMNEDIEKFFSSFGANQKPYFNISKNYKFNFKRAIYSIADNCSNLKDRIKKIKK